MERLVEWTVVERLVEWTVVEAGEEVREMDSVPWSR